MVYWDEKQVRHQINKIAETQEGRKNLQKVMKNIYDHEKEEAKKQKIAAYKKELLALTRDLYGQVQLQLSREVDFPTVEYGNHADLVKRCEVVLSWASKVSEFLKDNDNPYLPEDWFKKLENECK